MSSPFFPTRGQCPNRNKIERRLERFETRAQTRSESAIRQHMLRAFGSDRAIDLANVLQWCTDRDPCKSAACSPCFREFRKWSYSQARWLYDHLPDAHFLTLIFYDRATPNERLRLCELLKLNARLRRQLIRFGFTGPLYGYVELDYHTDINLWMPHYHLLLFGDISPVRALRKRLLAACKPFAKKYQWKCRPVKLSKVKNPVKQLSYLCKSAWMRVDAFYTLEGDRKTKKRRLRPTELELGLHTIHELEFSGLLFLYGLRRNGSDIKITAVTDK